LSVVNGIEKLTEYISINPTTYAIYEDFGAEVRKVVITKRCVMFYTIKDTHVEILGVFDTRQDLSDISL